MALSLASLALPAAMPIPALPGATMPMHYTFAKIIEGREPGEMLPLTLGTDEANRKRRHFHFIERAEDNMCEAD